MLSPGFRCPLGWDSLCDLSSVLHGKGAPGLGVQTSLQPGILSCRALPGGQEPWHLLEAKFKPCASVSPPHLVDVTRHFSHLSTPERMGLVAEGSSVWSPWPAPPGHPSGFRQSPKRQCLPRAREEAAHAAGYAPRARAALAASPALPHGPHPSQTSRSGELLPVPSGISGLPRAELETSPSIASCLSFSSRSCRVENPHPRGLQHGVRVRAFPERHLLLHVTSGQEPPPEQDCPLLSPCPAVPISCCPRVLLSPSPPVPMPRSSPHPRQVPVLLLFRQEFQRGETRGLFSW